jgi:hypothetical protein
MTVYLLISGDSGVVFAVLSLVVRDPAFKLEPYQHRYSCPVPFLQKDKIHALLPMLYIAKFDPNASISEVRFKFLVRVLHLNFIYLRS